MQEFIYYNDKGIDFPLTEDIFVTTNIEDAKNKSFIISNTDEIKSELTAKEIDFYIKNSHLKEVPALKEYTKLFMSEKMIGDDGILKEIGLIALDEKSRESARKEVMNSEKLTSEKLK